MAATLVQKMDVPEMYRCGYSGQVMVDPMVAVQTGKTYDKSSLKHLKQDEIQNLDFVLLPDLKAIIQKFLASKQDNQPEEIPQIIKQDQREQEGQENVAVDDLAVVAKQYQQREEELRSFDGRVSEAFEDLGEAKKNMLAAIQNYHSQKHQFCLVENQLEEMDLDWDSQVIWELRNQWLTASKLFFSIVDDCSQMLLHLFQKKQNFEQLLNALYSKEQSLIGLRDNLEKVFQSLRIQPQFMEDLSSRYTKPKQISENELQGLFTDASNVSDLSVHMERTECFKTIEINGSVCIKGLQVTSAMKGVKYLRFDLKNSDCKIEFIDCKFIGVGLWVYDQQENRNCVVMRNMEVSDAPEHCIVIINCSNFHMKQGTINNSFYSGLVLNRVSSSIVEDVTSSDVQHDAFYCYNSVTSLKNCVARNAKRAGVYAPFNSTVTAQNMTFQGNKQNTLVLDSSKYITI